MKLQTRLTVLFSLLALLPLLLTSYLGYLNQREALLQKTVEQMIAVADIQEKRINEKLDRYIEQAKLVTSRTQLRASLASYSETGAAAELDRMEGIIGDAVSSVKAFEHISILDLNGTVIATTDPERLGRSLHEESFFIDGQKVHLLTDIFKDENNVLKTRLAGPFALDGDVIGVVEIEASADPLISVTEDQTGLGISGEVILARKNASGDAVFLTPLRFDAGAALARAVPRDQTNVPMIPAVSGEEVVLIDRGIVDYRGHEVFAVTRFIDPLEWGLVIKIDRDEALSPITILAQSYSSIIGVSIFVIVIISLLVTRTITQPIDMLTEFAGRLKKGQFEGEVTVPSRDEIGFLAQAFNAMARQLSSLYANLENQVQDRTRKLEEALIKVRKKNADVSRQREATLNVLEDLNEERTKLEEAKAKDEAVLASMGDALVVTDTEGVVVLTNAAFERVTGYTGKDILGRKFNEVVASQEEDGTSVPDEKRSLVVVLKKKRAGYSRDRSHTHYYVRQDGGRFPVDAVATPILLDQRLVGAVEVFRDITQETQVDKAKTEFVSLASHQLRTPLSTINWYTELLMGGDAGKLTAQQKEYLQEIYIGNQRMVELVNSLLDVSRIELGTFSVEPEPTNIIELVQSVVHELKPDIERKKLKVEEKYAEKIPAIRIDPRLIRMVVHNLMTNAVKYTPEKGLVRVVIELEDQSLKIAVADTGMGIPQDQQQNIFTKLFRADNVRESDTTGTGLGLYIVKAIVDQSGGEIHFDSKENEGTTFTVSLPLSGMAEKKGTRRLGE